MFTRSIIGTDIIYKKDGEIVAAVLTGELLESIGQPIDVKAGLRYLVVEKEALQAMKPKHSSNLLASAKSKDGVHSMVTLQKYRYVQSSPKTVELVEI